jgi:hypothetical protein
MHDLGWTSPDKLLRPIGAKEFQAGWIGEDDLVLTNDKYCIGGMIDQKPVARFSLSQRLFGQLVFRYFALQTLFVSPERADHFQNRGARPKCHENRQPDEEIANDSSLLDPGGSSRRDSAPFRFLETEQCIQRYLRLIVNGDLGGDSKGRGFGTPLCATQDEQLLRLVGIGLARLKDLEVKPLLGLVAFDLSVFCQVLRVRLCQSGNDLFVMLLLFGTCRRDMAKDLDLPPGQILANTVKKRDLARGRGSLRPVEVLNGAQAEEEDAADGRKNCAEHGKAEDELAGEGKCSEEWAVFPRRLTVQL